jgi:mevalonate kinase
VTSKAVAEAPCKAIITGEHFVVHGSNALAAAMGKKVRVEVERASRLSIRSDRLSGRSPASMLPVRKVVSAMSSEYSFEPDLSLRITSAIPDSSGLGSSASTMVAVAAAVAELHSLNLPPEDLVRIAMAGEREIHGNPSGVDVNACAYGGVILYRMGTKPRNVRLESPRKLLVVYSGVRRSTKTMIGMVSENKRRRPGFFRGLANSVNELSIGAAERLSSGDLAGLGRLLTLNHAVLSSVGVSNEYIDDLVETLLSLGCLGAKLTGAGGGGSVIAIAPRGKGKSIISQLAERGFEAFEEEIPVAGVRSWQE